MRGGVALVGAARSGKDTIGRYLVQEHGYTRVAFADVLRDAAIRIDPEIPTAWSKLSAVVDNGGWEYAKDRHPEVRRLLEAIGGAMREIDPDIWLREGMRRVEAAPTSVVVTDCRYPNEAEALRAQGLLIVRVVRPGFPPRPAERQIDEIPVDARIVNDRSVKDLIRAVANLM